MKHDRENARWGSRSLLVLGRELNSGHLTASPRLYPYNNTCTLWKNAIRESPKAHWTKGNSCSSVISLMRKCYISWEGCFQISYNISKNLAFRFCPFLLCRVKYLPLSLPEGEPCPGACLCGPRTVPSTLP